MPGPWNILVNTTVVKDDANKTPIPGATIQLDYMNGIGTLMASRNRTSGPSGAFSDGNPIGGRNDLLAPSQVYITVTCPGYKKSKVKVWMVRVENAAPGCFNPDLYVCGLTEITLFQ